MTSSTREAMASPWLAISAGVVIAVAASVSLALRPLSLGVLLAALLALVPALLVRDARLYWLTLFIVALQFDVEKTVIDGVAVLNALRLDGRPWVFVPSIRLSDLPFAVLLALWLKDLWLRRTRLAVPSGVWLAGGFLVWAVFSLAGAPSRYLGAIELFRQAKFILVFLYVANAIDSDRALRRVWAAVLVIVLLQGAVTIFRFAFDFYDPFFGELFGRTEIAELPESRVTEDNYLLDPRAEGGLGGWRNSFGTSRSGATTSQLLLLGLPLAALACTRNAVFRRRLGCVLVLAVGLVGFVLTFSRSSWMGGVVAGLVGYWLAVRRGYLSARTAIMLGLVLTVTVVGIVPNYMAYVTRRLVNVEVRLEQYQTARAMLTRHPVLGVGLNNSMVNAREYGRFSFALSDVHNRTYEAPIHSFYLALLAEVGVIGFVLYSSSLLVSVRRAWRLSWPSGNPVDAFSAMAALLGLVALGAGVLTNPMFDDGVQTLAWLYAGIIASLDHRSGAGKPRPSP